MYTPKDLKNEGQHIFFKLLSFVIYSNLLYVVLLFLTVMIYARITGEYSSVESIINQLDTRFFTILNEISITIIGGVLFYRNKGFLIQEFKTVNRHFSTINFILYLFLLDGSCCETSNFPAVQTVAHTIHLLSLAFPSFLVLLL